MTYANPPILKHMHTCMLRCTGALGLQGRGLKVHFHWCAGGTVFSSDSGWERSNHNSQPLPAPIVALHFNRGLLAMCPGMKQGKPCRTAGLTGHLVKTVKVAHPTSSALLTVVPLVTTASPTPPTRS